jgi:hypothetical protein
VIAKLQFSLEVICFVETVENNSYIGVTKKTDAMNDNAQLKLALIDRNVEESHINQRLTDGYINATGLCQACGKNFGHYLENASTGAFPDALSSDIGIPISTLIQIVKGGFPQLQGTWVHPQVAIHLAQWASPKFAVFVSKWVFEWMSGRIPDAGRLPYHIQRYLINRAQIPPTHFSIFNEIVFCLIAPMEDLGYELPDKLVPDISQGRMFAKWVRDGIGLEPNDFPTYTHTYPDGRIIPNVKLYPNRLLGEFRDHFHNIWIKERAVKYFNGRDRNALPYLQKMIRTLPESDYVRLLAIEKDAKKNIAESAIELAKRINDSDV